MVPRMKCVVCGKPVPPKPENPWFPLCSERCKLVDLGRWLGEGYVIPGPAAGPDRQDGPVTSLDGDD